jgi:RimJ/RimL family protein N-acetyltransferase
MLPLETPRLVLRLPTEADIPAFLSMHTESDIGHLVIGGVRPSGDLEIAWRNFVMQLGHWQLRGFGMWLVEERATSDIIGRIGFWQSGTWPGIELGWLIRQARRNQGFATEAAVRALEWARTETTIERIVSLILPDNAPSLRIATKIGEQFERDIDFGGRLHHMYALTLER